MSKGKLRDSFWYWADRQNMQEIIVGPVEENGKDLPSGKKLGEYVNEKGRMDVLNFFEDHKKYFPTLWIIAQREAA